MFLLRSQDPNISDLFSTPSRFFPGDFYMYCQGFLAVLSGRNIEKWKIPSWSGTRSSSNYLLKSSSSCQHPFLVSLSSFILLDFGYAVALLMILVVFFLVFFSNICIDFVENLHLHELFNLILH